MDNSVINSREGRQKVKLIIIPAAEKTFQRQFADASGNRKSILTCAAASATGGPEQSLGHTR